MPKSFRYRSLRAEETAKGVKMNDPYPPWEGVSMLGSLVAPLLEGVTDTTPLGVTL